MKLEKLRAGMRVYDVHSHKMGNTTMSTVGVWHVVIHSVDLERQSVVASWNGNPAKTYSGRAIGKWREREPLLIRSGMRSRLATREEIKAAKLAESARSAITASGSPLTSEPDEKEQSRKP